MKLSYVDLCGFRGYRKPLRIDFGDGFTIIDGRNGVGKSTICDAVEFALTGTISKYLGARSDGETIADYLWWNGDGPPAGDHYVEVGFIHGDEVLPFRRSQLPGDNRGQIERIIDLLSDPNIRPENPLPQLCQSAIIRDEHIATLSLDLSESDRYALLRSAIGATDADEWIERGQKLSTQMKKRREAAAQEAESAIRALTAARSRIDELGSSIAEDSVIADALQRLQVVTGTTTDVSSIGEAARLTIASLAEKVEAYYALFDGWAAYEKSKQERDGLQSEINNADHEIEQAKSVLDSLPAIQSAEGSTITSQRAADLLLLADLGRHIGLKHGHCPLCDSSRGADDFARGIAAAESLAKELDAQAVEQAETERRRAAAQASYDAASDAANRVRANLVQLDETINRFEKQLTAAGLKITDGRSGIEAALGLHGNAHSRAREDLRVIDTLQNHTALQRAISAENAAKAAHAKAEEKLGLARLAEQRAGALRDAAIRAAGEALNQRLDRVLPLMAELYRRLRPHPFWGEIEYKIRGDVRRFLKLQVGEDLNPQFMFSSGQRRATGLAYLLSVNLSLAWSRWNTILLDDPVQHVDDFRSVHLAEVMAQLVAAGRQVVCVVEDPALADHLCRRLPVTRKGHGRRVTLGPDNEGALTKLAEIELAPFVTGALVSPPMQSAG